MYVQMTYASYIILSLAITVWVATTLYRNGRVFLIEAFQGDQALADAVNRLLLLAFSLLNIGFICLFLRYGPKPTNWIESIETISTKVGVVLIVSGGMHFFNMWNLAKLRKKSRPRVRIQSKPIRETQQKTRTA